MKMLTLTDEEVQAIENVEVEITNSDYWEMLHIQDYCKVLKEISDPIYHEALKELCNVALMKMQQNKWNEMITYLDEKEKERSE